MTSAVWRDRWSGGAAFCLASGPSLVDSDIELVREWRDGRRGRYVVVCNSTWERAPWADLVVGHDYQWWKAYWQKVQAGFSGARLSRAPVPRTWEVDRVDSRALESFGNTGALAISLAAHAGCLWVGMLGYDACLGPNGEVHHHPDHPRPMTNGRSIAKWPSTFAKVAHHVALQHVEVVNCSRVTALDCFPRAELEDVLRREAA